MGRRRPSAPVLLRESTQGAPARVDRAAGIIYGVKVLGRTSPNRHGVEGAERTEYTDGALRQARTLYEGRLVNVDHPPREHPGRERSALDRLGQLRAVEVRPDGLYADLHLLRSHPLADRLLEAAERMPELFALSHNAYGRGEVKNGVYVVSEIPEVRSVDVVADGGTTRSLFESQHMKKKFRDILESGKAEVKARFRRLLEDDSYGSMEMDGPAAPEGGSEGTMEDHLCAMVSAIIQDASLSMEEKKAKISQALKLLDDEQGQPEIAPTEEGEEDDDEKDKDVKESAERLCRLAGIEPAAELLESLAALGTRKARERHLVWLQGQLGKRGTSPRSAPPGSRSVQESALAQLDPLAQLAHLRG